MLWEKIKLSNFKVNTVFKRRSYPERQAWKEITLFYSFPSIYDLFDYLFSLHVKLLTLQKLFLFL